MMFRILVVDDDKNTRLLLKAVLQAENYTVFTAENGESALVSLILSHSLQCVISLRRGNVLIFQRL